MKTKPSEKDQPVSATVVVKQVTASGILYDTTSILDTDAAKRHIEALKQAQDEADTKQHEPAKE